MTVHPEYLRLHGNARKSAVQRVASQLLASYRERWGDLIPVELHRLAGSLQARIQKVKGLQGGARLLPVSGGFLVLVSDGLPPSKLRTSVAHELAHTLFYCRQSSTPRRLQKRTKEEEYFCFDVARLILAPDWLLQELGVRRMKDPSAIFAALHGQLRLSKPLAARVMLDDYALATGIAGRWELSAGNWTLQRGSAYASANLTSSQRKVLRKIATDWIQDRAKPNTPYHVLGFEDIVGKSAFVVVVSPPSSNQKEESRQPRSTTPENLRNTSAPFWKPSCWIQRTLF